MFWPSGACVASASITTSSSTITSTACPIAARAEVEARLTARTVEIFLKGERIAAHLRASDNGRHTTVPEHIPSRHRRYAGWTIARIRQDAARIGPATAASCEQILKHRPIPKQGFRACLGIVRLVRPFGAARLDAACARAIDIGTLGCRPVWSILDHKLDRHDASNRPPIARRSCTPTSAARATTIRRGHRAQPPDPGSAAPTRPHRHGSGFRRARSRHRGRPARMGDFVGIRKEPLKLQIGCRAPRPTQLTTCIAATTAEPSCIDMLRERFASGIAEKPIKYKLPF
jgi:hypothetical protein